MATDMGLVMSETHDEIGFNLDEIGAWTELKLDIIRKYAGAFSSILSNQPQFIHIYIDGFAGAGLHKSKTTGEEIAGSPINVASIRPRFSEYHLVEIDQKKASHLAKLFEKDKAVQIHYGDCNKLLVGSLLPQVRYKDYKRAFCLLDPYGLHLDWKVVELAGQMQTIDVLINFPTADMNRNVLWNNPDAVDSDHADRMSRFWGDDSWRDTSYGEEPTLFGAVPKKLSNDDVVQSYCERLKSVAGFAHVAEPLPMRNSKNAIVYYLVFASQKPVATKIMNDIFKSQR